MIPLIFGVKTGLNLRAILVFYETRGNGPCFHPLILFIFSLRQGVRTSLDAEKIGGLPVRLACDDLCAQLARNEKLAEAIGVERGSEGENAETKNRLEDIMVSPQVVADPNGTVNPAVVPIQSRVQVKEAERIKSAPFSDFLMDYARSELETVSSKDNPSAYRPGLV